MKNVGIVVGSVIGFSALIVGLVFGGRALGWWSEKTFAPKEEQVRYEVYKHSQAHIEGTVRTLRQYQVEYLKADADHQAAIASLILGEADKITPEETPSDLARFIFTLRNAQ